MQAQSFATFRCVVVNLLEPGIEPTVGIQARNVEFATGAGASAACYHAVAAALHHPAAGIVIVASQSNHSLLTVG